MKYSQTMGQPQSSSWQTSAHKPVPGKITFTVSPQREPQSIYYHPEPTHYSPAPVRRGVPTSSTHQRIFSQEQGHQAFQAVENQLTFKVLESRSPQSQPQQAIKTSLTNFSLGPSQPNSQRGTNRVSLD
jgi:hypothetical protein